MNSKFDYLKIKVLGAELRFPRVIVDVIDGRIPLRVWLCLRWQPQKLHHLKAFRWPWHWYMGPESGSAYLKDWNQGTGSVGQFGE